MRFPRVSWLSRFELFPNFLPILSLSLSQTLVRTCLSVFSLFLYQYLSPLICRPSFIVSSLSQIRRCGSRYLISSPHNCLLHSFHPTHSFDHYILPIDPPFRLIIFFDSIQSNAKKCPYSARHPNPSILVEVRALSP